MDKQIKIIIPKKISTSYDSESGRSLISALVPAFEEKPILLFS